ncbi:type II secretion system protein [Candidatus Parcubacteria bacterium]|nr:MAG: type II secretion system protein [Candidatus Parcubacteria bacterium]
MSTLRVCLTSLPLPSSRPSGETFTLIELLVVIAIIGILSNIVLASVSRARKKGYDARRQTYLRSSRTARECTIPTTVRICQTSSRAMPEDGKHLVREVPAIGFKTPRLIFLSGRCRSIQSISECKAFNFLPLAARIIFMLTTAIPQCYTAGVTPLLPPAAMSRDRLRSSASTTWKSSSRKKTRKSDGLFRSKNTSLFPELFAAIQKQMVFVPLRNTRPKRLAATGRKSLMLL